MSLKTDYYDGLTGFNSKMATVFDAGVSFVTSNAAALTAGLQAAAASGQKSFTINIVTGFEPANLRLNGIHLKTYLAGIYQQLGAEDIYNYEVSLALNTSDTITTSIDFKFSF